MVKVIDMVDGKVGKVVNVGDIKGMVFKGVEFESVGDDVYVDVGVKGMVLGDDVVNVDEFEVEEKDLVLLLSDGYRGMCCYEGWVVNDKGVFWLDLVNDGLVYKMKKV